MIKSALAYLKASDRSEFQIRQHLGGKFSETEIEDAISYLRSRKFVDDSRIASLLVSSEKLASARTIREKLRKIGISSEIMEATMASLGESGDGAALALLQKKGFLLTDRAKAGRFLYSKGFCEDEIEIALEQYFGEN